jgi:hypothetical protein
LKDKLLKERETVQTISKQLSAVIAQNEVLLREQNNYRDQYQLQKLGLSKDNNEHGIGNSESEGQNNVLQGTKGIADASDAVFNSSETDPDSISTVLLTSIDYVFVLNYSFSTYKRIFIDLLHS